MTKVAWNSIGRSEGASIGVEVQRIKKSCAQKAAQLLRRAVPLVAAILLATGLMQGSAAADSGTSDRVAAVTGAVLYNGGQAVPGTSYSRMVRLQYNITNSAIRPILATFEDFDALAFPIYESDDDGQSWHQISTISEQHNPAPWHLQWQPDLFELAQPINDLPAGTLLFAADSIGTGQQIELYTSTDQGHTWRFRSVVVNNTGAAGGKGVWEPNLQIARDGSLMVYFSDERQSPTYNQAIMEVRSTDGGLTWGSAQGVAMVAGGERPGMPVTTKLPNGNIMMSFETVGTPGNHVHVKVSTDGQTWPNVSTDGTAITTASGAFLGATPYITWIPAGGVNGTIFVSAQFLTSSPRTDRELMFSQDLGSTWSLMASPVQWQGGNDNCPNGGFDHAGWSQAMLATADGTGLIHMASSYIGACKNEMRFAREAVVLPNQSYMFLNQNSGQAIDVPGGQSTLSLGLEQYTILNNAAQNWTIQDIGNDTLTMLNVGNGLAWDDPRGESIQGDPVQQYSQTHVTAQQWQLLPVGNGYWRLKNLASGLVMAVNQQSQSPGAPITQWTDNGTPDHNWRPSQGSVANGTYKIVASTTGTVLDGSTNSNAAGKPVDLWSYWHAPFQRWYIQNLNNGYYSIRTINTDGTLGTSLDATNCSGADNTQVEMYTNNGAKCQQWAITPVGSNTFKISTAQPRSDGTFDVLDGSNCSGAAGTNVVLWPWGGGSCQQTWYIQASY